MNNNALAVIFVTLVSAPLSAQVVVEDAKAAKWVDVKSGKHLEFENPWPDVPGEVARLSPWSQIRFKDDGGEYVVTTFSASDGDCCNGWVKDALEIHQKQGSTWKRVWRSRMYESSYNTESYVSIGHALNDLEILDLDKDGTAEVLHGVIINPEEKYRLYVRSVDSRARIIAEVDAPLARLIDQRTGSISVEDANTYCPSSAADVTFYSVDEDGKTTNVSKGEAAKKWLPAGYFEFLSKKLLNPEDCVLR